MLKTEVEVDLKLNDIFNQLDSSKVDSKELGYYVSGAVHRHYTPAMPFNTGNFSQQIKFEPWQYTHLMPYSAYTYNLNMNFRKDKHPYAMANYIEGYASVAEPKIEKDVANFIKNKVVK